MSKRIILGMSGGVDSSTSVILLQNQGYEVVGVTFAFTPDFDPSDAILVAKKLGIEHHVVDYKKEFKELVIDKFINDYKSGITPNPCANCNRNVKLKFLYDLMKEYNCDYIATGHYAKVLNGNLYRSVDLNKDQTYFLSLVPKEILNHIVFPLEGIEKIEVRKLANKNGLEVANKKDSFDVCFISETFKEFMKEEIKTNQGDIVNVSTKEVIGRHNGLSYYTIGQRRGLNIGGNTDRLFVVGKDIEKNILYVALGDDNDYLVSDSCLIENVNYLKNEKIENATAKFRYRSSETKVTLEYLDDNKILVKYDEKVKGVTPGQVCALYDDNECIGGGIIKEVRKNNEKVWYL